MNPVDTLKNELREIADLKGAVELMLWDMETYMPPGGAKARARQVAMLEALAHERFIGEGVSKPLGELVDLDSGEPFNGADDETNRLVKEIWKDYHRAAALPTEFVEEMSQTTSLAQPVWVEARKKNNFNMFALHLEKIISLKYKEIEYLGIKGTPYDTLLDEYEPGVTTADIDVLFGALKKELVPMVKAISDSGIETKREILLQYYDPRKQWEFSELILKEMHYDFNCGRQDKAAHPFSTSFHPTDARVTTRVNDNNLMYCLSSSIHEGGHALYEQGLDQEWYGTPFCEAISYGIHESQSRLWENLVGLSKPFWEYYFPKLQKVFPENLSDVSLDDFYMAVNTVKPDLIRTEADEITYNLHIMLRYEIEQMIINNGVEVSALPEIWNNKMEEYLGITPPSDADGVLQDVHWAHGSFGYFPTYALGNLYNIIMFNKAKEELPNMAKDCREGNFLPLRNWLKDNIHIVGRRQTAKEMIKSMSGQDLSSQPFIDYLKKKYSEIYPI